MRKKMEKVIYGMLWALAALGTAAYFGLKNIKALSYMPCLFYRVTGFYCPGCGGTRAFWELCHGHLLKSLWYHPLVPYVCVLSAWYLFSHTIEYLSRGKWKMGMKYRNIYLYLCVILVMGNWVVKNLLLAVWGITL